MPANTFSAPSTDPTPIFELFRGAHATELLTIAVSHFNIFGRLSKQNESFETLRIELGLEHRPAMVLFTALKAMGFLKEDPQGILSLTALAAEHLIPGGEFDCGNYVGLAAQSPGVIGMLELLRSNKPVGSGDHEPGTAFIFRDGMRSAMEATESARHFTLALAGRAKNVAHAFANAIEIKDTQVIMDVGGGTGIYTYALLQQNPRLRAVILDHAEVLKIAKEMATTYDVADRCEFFDADMFQDELPEGIDSILLSNILHDWDVPECEIILQRCASALPRNGRIFIHDVFLDDDLHGPLPIALYSASLFSFTEGRAYSAAEYKSMLEKTGFKAVGMKPTLVHCGVLEATKTEDQL